MSDGLTWQHVLSMLAIAGTTYFWLWFVVWEVEQRKKEAEDDLRRERNDD